MPKDTSDMPAQLAKAEQEAARDKEKVAKAEARAQQAQQAYSEARQKALDASAAQKEAAQLLSQLKKTAASSEELQQAQTALYKARKAEKSARQALANIHELTKQEVRKAEKAKEQVKQRLIIVDGYVVDQFGTRLRPYGRFERFVDNKPLAYGTLVAAFIIMLTAVVLFFKLTAT